jgi:putative ABC transport system permease protein
MRGLAQLALRSLAARRARTALTIGGISLGIAVLVAAMAVNAGIETAIDRTVADIAGRADLRVTAFEERGLSPASLEAIRATAGVEVAAPALERRTYLGADPSAGGGLRPPVTVLGVDAAIEPQVHPYELAGGLGLDPADDAGVLVTQQLASEDGLAVGDSLTIQGIDQREVQVVGIVAGRGPLVGSSGRTVIAPIATVADVFDVDRLTRVDVVLADGTDALAVAASLERSLTLEPYVLSAPADTAASLRASTTDFRQMTALLGIIALFGGAFLIFNTLSMTVAERLREIGLFRAAGMTRRQVSAFVLLQALVVGVVGALLGVLLGLLLARLIAGVAEAATGIETGLLEIPPDRALLAAVLGVLVTLAGAIEPALRASRISPVEALKARIDPGDGRQARLRWLVVVFVAVAASVVLIWPDGPTSPTIIRPLLVYAILLVLVLLTPVLVRPAGALVGALFALLFRAEERLALGAIRRDPSRTALTVAALTVGLAMIVAIGGVGQYARASAGEWLSDVIPGDDVLTAIRPIPSDDTTALDAVAAVPGVERVTAVGSFDAAFRGARLAAAAVDGAAMLADGRLVFVAGDRSAALAALDAGGSVVLPSSVADRLGLAVGDSMTFTVAGGEPLELSVAGIVEHSIPGRSGEAMLVGWADALARFGVVGADFLAVRYAAGGGSAGSVETARDEVAATARLYALEPSTLGAVESAIGAALGRVFGLFDAIAVIAVIIGALGIVNTLTMSVLERVREIGVLRATGMTRRQVRRMVIVEAGILGGIGALLGIVGGLVTGAVLVVLAGGRLDISIGGLPWQPMALAVVLGLAASMLAAAYPSVMASRISIVRAVQAE